MPRFHALDPVKVSGDVKRLLDRVKRELGMIPNQERTLANHPALLETYLALSSTLANGRLPETLREQIVLTVAEANGCEYCVAAHTAIAKAIGLSDEDALDSRRAISSDRRVEVALQFTRKLVDCRGHVSDKDVARLRRHGYTDTAIFEIVASVALSTFTNYFNLVAGTLLDFPRRMNPRMKPARSIGW